MPAAASRTVDSGSGLSGHEFEQEEPDLLPLQEKEDQGEEHDQQSGADLAGGRADGRRPAHELTRGLLDRGGQ